MSDTYVYEISFDGKEDLWSGNTPLYLDMPDWPNSDRRFGEEDCSELSGSLSEALSFPYREDVAA